MDHKVSEIDHVTPLFNLFLVVHLPTHSVIQSHSCLSSTQRYYFEVRATEKWFLGCYLLRQQQCFMTRGVLGES